MIKGSEERRGMVCSLNYHMCDFTVGKWTLNRDQIDHFGG